MFIGKGNISIKKEKAKRIEDGKIIKDLPLVNWNGELLPLFSVITPSGCSVCDSKLHKNKCYNRYVISSYGVVEIPVTYWECSNEECAMYYADEIVGVKNWKNYSEEYLSKLFHTRYESKTSLFNTRRTGEIFVGDFGECARAACPTTLWRYEQERGQLSLEKLQDTDVPFNGTIHIDGDWVKNGWRKFVEESMGRELTDREWKKLRYKVVYVASTEDKVILDFVITDIQPSYLSLIPLISRLKERLGEDNIDRVVSDEDSAIIDAVKLMLPEADHAFCVFHQLTQLTKIYLQDFKELKRVPEKDREFYEKGKELLMAKNAIESMVLLHELEEMLKNGLRFTSKRAMNYLREKHKKNRDLLEKGFEPDTNNVMEQLFSFLDDFIYQAKSFKILSGLKNWAANMFSIWNHREFNTGPHRGMSPLDIARAVEAG